MTGERLDDLSLAPTLISFAVSQLSIAVGMGVPDLWRILKPAAEYDTLLSLATAGFSRVEVRGYRLGVDASLWLFVSAAAGCTMTSPDLARLQHARKMDPEASDEVGA